MFITGQGFLICREDLTLQSREAKEIGKKLDSVKLELIRPRAQLLPEEEATEQERRDISAARKEYSKGRFVTLKELLRDIGE